jgi:hypothetical protein
VRGILVRGGAVCGARVMRLGCVFFSTKGSKEGEGHEEVAPGRDTAGVRWRVDGWFEGEIWGPEIFFEGLGEHFWNVYCLGTGAVKLRESMAYNKGLISIEILRTHVRMSI